MQYLKYIKAKENFTNFKLDNSLIRSILNYIKMLQIIF